MERKHEKQATLNFDPNFDENINHRIGFECGQRKILKKLSWEFHYEVLIITKKIDTLK